MGGLKQVVKKLFLRFDLELRDTRRPSKTIPDWQFYRPVFSPWEGFGDFEEVYQSITRSTLVPRHSAYMLRSLAQQALALEGEFWECGVYKGGTARMLAATLAGDPRGRGRILRLFDTFSGMPPTDSERDWHQEGDFKDTSIEAVRANVGHPESTTYHQGFIPDTFAGLEGSVIAFAHVDVDIYRSVYDCTAFIYSRLVPGGIIVYDDYGVPTCPGARQAVDEFFSDKPEVPLILPTGQAIVVALGDRAH